MLAVSFGESREVVERAALRRGYDGFRVAVDTRGLSTGLYRVVLRPQTFVIDAQGIVRAALAGPVGQQAWQAELEPLLGRP